MSEALKSLSDKIIADISALYAECGKSNKKRLLNDIACIKLKMDDVRSFLEEEKPQERKEFTTLDEMEENYIRRALAKYNGSILYSSKELGCCERTLFRKMKQYRIDRRDFVEQNYTIESLKGKHKERCVKIISWIGNKNEFWLDELKQEFGYDSKETRIPVNAVINYMKGQKFLRQSGYDNKRRQYVLSENANTQDILAQIGQEN